MKYAYIRAAVLALFCTGLILPGCGRKKSAGKPVIFVSILPQAYFAERVAGDHVSVEVLAGPGQSPHSFEPTPKQMAKLAEADVFFTIGIPFEKGFVHKIKSSNPRLKIVPTDTGITKRRMKTDRHHDEKEGHAHEKTYAAEHKGGADPHVWLDPVLVKGMAEIMCDTLSGLMPENKKTFRKNLDAFTRDLNDLDRKIADVLKPLRGRKFFVFHPAFGYFGDRYGLDQQAVEIEGKEPGARQLARLTEEAKEEGVRVLFVQPQFAKTSAATVAQEIGGAVVPIDPLARNYIQNLTEMADTIKNSLQKE